MGLINEDIDACDVFILLMWRRWGQEAPMLRPFTSYTEEEFYRALARHDRHGKPTIFVFFKHIEPGQMADPGPQLSECWRSERSSKNLAECSIEDSRARRRFGWRSTSI